MIDWSQGLTMCCFAKSFVWIARKLTDYRLQFCTLILYACNCKNHLPVVHDAVWVVLRLLFLINCDVTICSEMLFAGHCTSSTFPHFFLSNDESITTYCIFLAQYVPKVRSLMLMLQSQCMAKLVKNIAYFLFVCKFEQTEAHRRLSPMLGVLGIRPNVRPACTTRSCMYNSQRNYI